MDKDEKYYNSLDKRSKEYKDYKKSLKELDKSQGLGDTIEKITKATGIKKLTELILGDDCGCDERKHKLNRIYNYHVECLTVEEYNQLKDYFSRQKSVVERSDINMLTGIHNRIFHANLPSSSCGPCIKKLIKKLKLVFDVYIKENL